MVTGGCVSSGGCALCEPEDMELAPKCFSLRTQSARLGLGESGLEVLLTVPSSGLEKPHLTVGLERKTVTPPSHGVPSASVSPPWGTCSPGEVGKAGRQHRHPLLGKEIHWLPGILPKFRSELFSVPRSRSRGPLFLSSHHLNWPHSYYQIKLLLKGQAG